MPEGPDGKTIIVVKKVSGHGGHHGGAWKVAYADFVTAMMALFMVLWLVNSASVTTRERIASYFRRPGVFLSGSGTPLEFGGAGILPDTFAPTTAGNSSITPTRKIYDVQGLAQGKFREGFGRGEGTEAGDELRIAQLEKIAKDIYRAIGAGRNPGQSGSGSIPGAGDGTSSMQRDATGDWTGEIKVKVAQAPSNAYGKIVGGGLGPKEGHGFEDGEGEGAGQGPAPLPGKGLTGSGGEQTAGAGTAEGSTPGGTVSTQTAEASDEAVEIKPGEGDVEGESAVGDVEISVDKEGLHIEIMDTPTASMFEPGSAKVSQEAAKELQKIAAIILGLKDATLSIEGHTDAKPFRGGSTGAYSNWDLSADRANAARRLLQESGIQDSQITGVHGMGSQLPKFPEDPLAPGNRRISITLQYTPEAKEALGDKVLNKDEKKEKNDGKEVLDTSVKNETDAQDTIFDLEALGVDITRPDWIYTDESKLLYHLGLIDVLPADVSRDDEQVEPSIEEVQIEDVAIDSGLSESSKLVEDDQITIDDVNINAHESEQPETAAEVIEEEEPKSKETKKEKEEVLEDLGSDSKPDWNDKQQIFNNDSAFFGEESGR